MGLAMVTILAMAVTAHSEMSLDSLWKRMDAAYAGIGSFAGTFAAQYGDSNKSTASLLLIDDIVVFESTTDLGQRMISSSGGALRWSDSSGQPKSTPRRPGREVYLQLLEVGQFPFPMIVAPFTNGTSTYRKMLADAKLAEESAGYVIRGKTTLGSMSLHVSKQSFLATTIQHKAAGMIVEEKIIDGYLFNNRTKILDTMKKSQSASN